METDRSNFVEGLFVIAFAVGIALFFVWLTSSGHRDDVVYRIHFGESVSGLSTGDPVKFHGVDVGAVKSLGIDPVDPRLVQVDVSLRKDTPVKTDTKASLNLKGFTGVVFVELSGGSASARSLIEATPPGRIPEITYEKSNLASVLDQLPAIVDKLSALEDQGKKVLTDAGSLTARLKENPSLLIFPSKEKPAPVKAGREPPIAKSQRAGN